MPVTIADKPRSIWSVVVIGLLLGPVFLMLWLGRGRWVLVYLAASMVLSIGVGTLEDYGLISARPVLTMWTAGDVASVGAQYLIGLAHGLYLRETSFNRPWYRWLAFVPLALLVVMLPSRVFVLQPFTVPSQSEHPNLVLGDYFLVNKFAYGYSRYSFPFGLVHFEGRLFGHHPRRGDIAVFRLPADDSVDYVKRVIGLPGDRIQMVGGRLYINDSEVERTPIALPDQYKLDPAMTFYRETLPEGASYAIAEMGDNATFDDTAEYTVPAGHYFVMGDNRDNSQDSRHLNAVGYIPEDNFIGPLAFRLWTADGFAESTRPPEVHPAR